MQKYIQNIIDKYTTDHIVKQSESVQIHQYFERQETPQQLVVVADANDYRTILYVGKISFGTCNCTGFFIRFRCKHIYAAAIKLQRSHTKERL